MVNFQPQNQRTGCSKPKGKPRYQASEATSRWLVDKAEEVLLPSCSNTNLYSSLAQQASQEKSRVRQAKKLITPTSAFQSKSANPGSRAGEAAFRKSTCTRGVLEAIVLLSQPRDTPRTQYRLSARSEHTIRSGQY